MARDLTVPGKHPGDHPHVEIPTKETDDLTGEEKMVDKPHWVVGTKTDFRKDDDTVVAGETSLPDRSEEGTKNRSARNGETGTWCCVHHRPG